MIFDGMALTQIKRCVNHCKVAREREREREREKEGREGNVNKKAFRMIIHLQKQREQGETRQVDCGFVENDFSGNENLNILVV